MSSRKMIRNVSWGSGPLLAAQDLSDDLVFPRGGPDLNPLVLLELTDLRDDLGATIQETDEVLIEAVDLSFGGSRDWGDASSQ